MESKPLVVCLVDFNKTSLNFDLGRSDVQRLYRLFDNIEIRQGRPDKKDTGPVIEEQRLLIASSSLARNSITTEAGSTCLASTKPGSAAAESTLARDERRREVNASSLEELADQNLDVAHQVLPCHRSQTKAALTSTAGTASSGTTTTAEATATATTATTANATTTLLTTVGRSFNAGNEYSRLALSTTATATTTTTTATTTTTSLREITDHQTIHCFQPLEERIGINAELTGEKLLRLRQPLSEYDSIILNGNLKRPLSDLCNRINRVCQTNIPQTG